MTRYLLETNIISNVIKPEPSGSLLDWMGAQKDEDLFIRKRDALDAWFAGPEGPQALFAGRVLSFDKKAGLVWARLMANGKAKGRSRSALDTIIAAVAESNEYVVVTDDEKDFEDVQIINPLHSSGSQEPGR
ncbi:VapC toxin family PIN domain ribonuclease [Mesorhizobium australicum]|uniref:PIN domain-containing protein n=1 Tax=Mesorhizobium australicum TaxID=536018 RepID=UPI00333DE882